MDFKASPISLPLYVQLSEALIREVAAGRLVEGDKLPPERDMAATYGTTVTTLRKALKILADKGLLRRVHGSGNYVRGAQDVESVYAMFRLELKGGGGLPSAQVLDVARMNKDRSMPAFGQSVAATRIRRLRLLDQRPIALEEIWLDGAAGAVEASQLQDSLYRYYRMQLGFWISRAEDKVSVASVPFWRTSSFPLEVGTLAGYVERLSWAQSREAIEFSRTWFDPRQASYVQRFR